MWKMNKKKVTGLHGISDNATDCFIHPDSGVADVIGRKFGSQKLPYNNNKSIAGSVAMLTAGFIASVG